MCRLVFTEKNLCFRISLPYLQKKAPITGGLFGEVRDTIFRAQRAAKDRSVTALPGANLLSKLAVQ